MFAHGVFARSHLRQGIAMKGFLLGIVAGAALVPVAAILVLVSTGMSARSTPSPLEATAARTVRRWAMPEGARNMENPARASREVLSSAMLHFADHCAGCHANDGSGQTALGRAMYPPAPDLRAAATQNLADGELFRVIEDGIRFTGMPAFGPAGKPEESWALVRFLRHLPELTPEELAVMEAANPRSLEEWRELQEEERFLRGEDVPSGQRRGTSHDHGDGSSSP